MAFQQPALAIDGQSHSALLWRRFWAFLAGEGVGNSNNPTSSGSDDCKVLQNTGSDRKVKIKAGGCLITGDSAAYQGRYFAFNDADIIDIAVPAADVTNPRLDIVVVQISDVAYGAGSSGVAHTYIAGTPLGTPVAPPVPDSALLLATVAVAANQTTIVDANITDNRIFSNTVGLAPSAKVYRATDFSVPNNALTVIPWTAEDYDALGLHGAGANTIICKAGYSGLWMAVASAEFTNNNVGLRRLEIWKTPNGGSPALASKETLFSPYVGTDANMPPVIFEGRMADLDALEVRAYQDSGGALNIKAGAALTWFAAHRIGG